jgi:hypothetical protein
MRTQVDTTQRKTNDLARLGYKSFMTSEKMWESFYINGILLQICGDGESSKISTTISAFPFVFVFALWTMVDAASFAMTSLFF